MSANSAAKELTPYIANLTEMQRIFVLKKLEGYTDIAAATAAGLSNPRNNVYKYKQSPAIQEALQKGIEIMARETMFTRKQAHEMLLDAHRNAENTTEQVTAIRELVKLHGIAAPEVKEIRHEHSGAIEHREVKELTDEQLLKLARLPTEQLPHVIEDVEYEEIGQNSGGETGREESGEASLEEEEAEEAAS